VKKIILIGLSILALNATNLDSDLDGVLDAQDMCPNTPFLETVNKYGCSKQQLIKKSKIKFNISMGYEHDKYKNSSDDLLLATLTAYTKKFSFIYYYSNSDGKSNDSILSIYYKKPIAKNTKLKIGLKTYFPTDLNDKIDYALKIKATYYSNWAYSISEKHKIYTESSQNTKDTITVEAGKLIKKYYISPYAYTENSSYDSNDWHYYAGFFTQHQINKKLSLSLNLSADIEDISIYSVVTNIGYSF